LIFHEGVSGPRRSSKEKHTPMWGGCGLKGKEDPKRTREGLTVECVINSAEGG